MPGPTCTYIWTNTIILDQHKHLDLHGHLDQHGYLDLHGHLDPHGHLDLHGQLDQHVHLDQRGQLDLHGRLDQRGCDYFHLLAILVVVFADVAEMSRECLHSQRTGDLSALPLDDHT